MTPAQEKIEKLLQQQKPFTAEEAHTAGISAQMLAHYCRKGKLERACRGIYTPPETEITHEENTEIFPEAEQEVLEDGSIKLTMNVDSKRIDGFPHFKFMSSLLSWQIPSGSQFGRGHESLPCNFPFTAYD